MNFLRRASGPGKTLSFCLGESFYFSSGATLFRENLSYLPLDFTGFHGDILILIGCFVFFLKLFSVLFLRYANVILNA